MAVAGSQSAAVEAGEPLATTRIGARALVLETLRRPSAAASAFVLLLVVVVAIFGPAFAPYDPNAIVLGKTLASPTVHHLLGTDSLGRDNFSRLIYGTRIALEVALPSVIGAFIVGGALGLFAGYIGGLPDKVLVVVFDAVVSFPAVILGLALLTLLGPSISSVVLVIAIALIPYYGRLVRGQTLSERRNQYVKAERALGASRSRVLLRHLLPNVLPPMLIIVAMDIPGAISIEAGLAFLGLGVQPPTADWGVMLNGGFTDIGTSPWEIIGPIAALILVTSAFTLLGEALRDALDPKHTVRRRGLRDRLRASEQA
jgi:peptide/nickel transport system permease protein